MRTPQRGVYAQVVTGVRAAKGSKCSRELASSKVDFGDKKLDGRTEQRKEVKRGVEGGEGSHKCCGGVYLREKMIVYRGLQRNNAIADNILVYLLLYREGLQVKRALRTHQTLVLLRRRAVQQADGVKLVHNREN